MACWVQCINHGVGILTLKPGVTENHIAFQNVRLHVTMRLYFNVIPFRETWEIEPILRPV